MRCDPSTSALSPPSPPSSIHSRPVVLLSSGAFDPPTYAHLRMMERARDFLERSLSCRVVEGLICPDGDDPTTTETSTVGEEGRETERVPARHRMRMVEAALRRSSWIRAADYATTHSSHIRELAVLKHYQKEAFRKHGADVRVVLVCGSDVVEEFAHIRKGRCRWNQDELSYLLTHHALVVVRRGRQHPAHTIYLMDVLRNNQKNIFVIEDETSPGDVSSSRIRRAIRRGESVKYCADDSVIEYIEEHRLYTQISKAGSCLSECSTRSAGSATSSSSTSSSIRTAVQATENDHLLAITSSATAQPTEAPPTLTDPAKATPSIVSEPSVSEVSSPVWKSASTSSQEEVKGQSIGNGRLGEGKEKDGRTKHEATCAVYAHVRKNFHPQNMERLSAVIQNGNLKANGKRLDNSAVEAEEAMPSPPPPSSFRPILSQRQLYELIINEPQPVADSPIPLPPPPPIRNPLPMPPSRMEIQPPNSFKTSFPPPMESPLYDNVTLDELLLASTSWAEYMADQSSKLKQADGESYLMDTTPATSIGSGAPPPRPPPPPPVTSEKKEKRKGGWFFCRSKSVKDPKEKPISPSDDESLVRICGSDRRNQQQTSPEILWRKISQISMGKERWSDLPPSPKKSVCSRAPATVRSPEKPPRKDNKKNIRFAQQMTKSAENLNQAMTPPPCQSIMSQSCHAGSSGDVTLTFRRYRLAATPETTV